jgi:hypothetical protein
MNDTPRKRRRLAAALLFVAVMSAATLPGCGGGAGAGAQQKRPSASEVRRQGKAWPAAAPEQRAPYGAPTQVATLEEKAVRESSGLAASRRNPDTFWTHNDSGDGPHLYAFDRAGRSRGVWAVSGARAVDWEDMAAGPGPQGRHPYLYVADTGDNERRRAEVTVYRVAEPEVAAEDAASDARAPRQTEPAEAIRLRYPDGAHDAETLLVHPSSGDLYVVTKEIGRPAGVYKLAAARASTSSVNTLERVGEVMLPGIFGGLVTGGDISPDGRRVVLCDYVGVYEFSLAGDGGGGGDAGAFDGVWTKEPLLIDFGERRQGEAVCYGPDGQSVFATSEKRPVPLIEVRREASKK